MKVIETDNVLKSLRKKKMPANVKSSIYKEIERLHKIASDNQHMAYLKSQNGKKLKGAKKRNNIFKYRLSDGDRLIYTYGKYIKGIPDEDRDALVIIDCVTHDKQGLYKKQPLVSQFTGGSLLSESRYEEEASDKDFAVLEVGTDAEHYLNHFRAVHRLFIFDEQLEEKKKYDDMDVYLSEEQNDYIQEYLTNPCPTLILGGAGTGKTIMALHILHDYQCENPDARCIYFTHSQELLKKAKAKFHAISWTAFGEESRISDDENVEFWDIAEFCIHQMKQKRADRVGYDMFYRFVEHDTKMMRSLSKWGIFVYDLWAEIQGTIKGGLDQDWCRVDWVDWRQHESMNNRVMSELRKCDLIEENEDDSHLFCLKKNAYTKVREGTAVIAPETQKVIAMLQKNSAGVDADMPLQRKDIYLKMSEENTTLERDVRPALYAFCEGKYKRWLEDHGRYDDNDLARMMLNKHRSKDQKYDLIIIDEIQDYTELQIYLIKEMAKYTHGIVMAGDSHQIVNPTMFREQRIRQLFKKDKQELSICVLEKNFRSQRRIVEYANAVASMRRKKIAKTDIRTEVEESAIYSGAEPVKMRYTEQNMFRLMDKLLDYPGAVILTANEREKQRMIQLYGEENYVQKKNKILFTVEEIKGMEYKAVFCLNLVGTFQDAWNRIFQGEARRKTKYRYYFNLLYVGVSRAQDHLCMIEENPNQNFEYSLQKELPYKIREIQDFDTKALYLEELDNSEEEWRIQAERYKKQGKYEEAVDSLRKAGAGEIEIMECRMYQCIQENDFVKMMEYALCLENKEEAETYYEELDKRTKLSKLIRLWLSPAETIQKGLLSADTIVSGIAECFPDMEQSWSEKIQIMYLRILSEHMLAQAKRLKENRL